MGWEKERCLTNMFYVFFENKHIVKGVREAF